MISHVSIHAPVRGATRILRKSFKELGVSIHAPVRGATHLITKKMQLSKGFNPRARAGRDTLAPRQAAVMPLFQSTRPCGARQHRLSRISAVWRFQSTRPCGARPTVGHASTKPTGFQSTRPCGARHDHSRLDHRSAFVSIHAPVRGATFVLVSKGASIVVSIHAPVRGATLLSPAIWESRSVSIHAPVRGATPSRQSPAQK